jgi:hypothetical protein
VSQNAVRALFEEWDRARLEIVDLLPRIRDDELELGDPLDQTRTRGILIHVLRAGYGYASWICEVLGFPTPERAVDPKTLAGREAFQRGFHDMREFFARAIEPLEDEHLEPGSGAPPPHFKSRWGEDYGVEQMLEHAVCHNLRHRRQLSRRSIFKA